MTLSEKVNWHYRHFLKHRYPFLWSRHLSKEILGKTTNFRNPMDLNEKIQWLMFYTDTRLWTMLADKFAVRQYVAKRVGSKYLVPLLGQWTSAEDIDFSQLPDKFVMKPNNGSYDAVICRDKSALDIEDTRSRMSYSLKHKFGYENAEPHYLDISPCIIAEEYLESNAKGGLIDYKIWCFNGKPYGCFVVANRDNSQHKSAFSFYDLNWVCHHEYMTRPFRSGFECPRPKNFDEMLEVATRLSEGLPQARIDLYNLNGRIYFGEITMSSNFGMMTYFTQNLLNEMGDNVILPARSVKEKVSTFCKRWLPRL